jgi:hypothetical protein
MLRIMVLWDMTQSLGDQLLIFCRSKNVLQTLENEGTAFV